MDRLFSNENGTDNDHPMQRRSVVSARNLTFPLSTQNFSRSTSEKLGSDGQLKHGLIAETDLTEIARAQLCCSDQNACPQNAVDTRWYRWWLSQQILCAPARIFSTLPAQDGRERAEAFTLVWTSIADFVSHNEIVTIDQIVDYLESNQLLNKQPDRTIQTPAKSLVFAILGWQTMLFRADCGSCPANCLAIAEETSIHDDRTHQKLRSLDSASRKPVHKCLLWFGVLLPPKNCNLSTVAEHKKAFNEFRDISSSDLNASLLTRVGLVEIKWTSCLSCHLEFDVAARCLYLFRYPSFCIANRNSSTTNLPRRTALHACAQPSASDLKWATRDEVSDLLEEVLMSYRLLFGQHKESRRLFRNLEPFEGAPSHAHDRALFELCGRKHSQVHLIRADRKHWDLKHDFPMLRSRLSALAYEMSIKKPRSWSQLWNDRRDSAQWATFWLILIFGAIGLFLSLVQVILQAAQLSQNS